MAQKLMRFVLPGMLVIGQLIGIETAHGAAGSFDPTFGTGGVAVTNLALSGVNTIRLQSTGDIIVLALAPTSNEVFRYTTEGELDTSFGNNGVADRIRSL